MALTPKEAARLALMERIVPLVKPYFDHAKAALVNGFPADEPGQLDLSSLLLILVADDLRDEYLSLKARQ